MPSRSTSGICGARSGGTCCGPCEAPATASAPEGTRLMKRRPLRGMTLRVRLMALGVAGVALALALGSVVLYAVLTFTVNRTVDDGAFATGRAVAAMVSENTVPDPLPVSGSQVVQVVDRSGAVVSG